MEIFKIKRKVALLQIMKAGMKNEETKFTDTFDQSSNSSQPLQMFT
jgi:hypothetical protein